MTSRAPELANERPSCLADMVRCDRARDREGPKRRKENAAWKGPVPHWYTGAKDWKIPLRSITSLLLKLAHEHR